MDKGNLNNYLNGDGQSLTVEGRYKIVGPGSADSTSQPSVNTELGATPSLRWIELPWVSLIVERTIINAFVSTFPLSDPRRSYRRMLPVLLLFYHRLILSSATSSSMATVMRV